MVGLHSIAYQHDALNQSWVNVGPPSVTQAHIKRNAKHDAVTQYWPTLAQIWVNVSCLLGRRLHEQTEVNQHVPTSVYFMLSCDEALSMCFNPWTAKLNNFNFHQPKVVSRCRDSLVQVFVKG